MLKSESASKKMKRKKKLRKRQIFKHTREVVKEHTHTQNTRIAKVSFRFLIFALSSSLSSSLLFIDSYVVGFLLCCVTFYANELQCIFPLLVCLSTVANQRMVPMLIRTHHTNLCVSCFVRDEYTFDGFFSLFYSLSPYEPHNMHKFVHILICQLHTHTHIKRYKTKTEKEKKKTLGFERFKVLCVIHVRAPGYIHYIC